MRDDNTELVTADLSRQTTKKVFVKYETFAQHTAYTQLLFTKN